MTTLTILTNKDGNFTMSSLDMVNYINSQRGDSEAELRHDSFMVKVKEVLGEDADKFRTTYRNPQNAMLYASYAFPKREAMLMAMSYSYKLQAYVFDSWTAHDQLLAKKALPEYACALAHADLFAEIRDYCLKHSMPEKMAIEFANARTKEILRSAKRKIKDQQVEAAFDRELAHKRKLMLLKVEERKLLK